MNLSSQFARLAPQSLFGRMVAVWLLCFLVMRLVSFADITLRADYLFLRIIADTEARFMALHVRLLSSSSARIRDELVHDMGRDEELRVQKSNKPLPLLEEDTAISRQFAQHTRELLRSAGRTPRKIRASMQIHCLTDEDARLRNEIPRKSEASLPMELPLALPEMFRERSAEAHVSVEYAPGAWVNLVHRVDKLPRTILYFSLTRFIGEILLMAILALTTVFWIVRPLRELAAATESFGRTMETPALPETSGPSEIRHAARAFNSMREHILSFVRQKATLLAAISHDLRTPLTRIRLRLEGVDDESLRTALLADVEEVQHTLESLMQGMRSLNAPSMKPDRVDFMSLVEGMTEDMQDMGLTVTLQGRVDGSFWLPPLAVKRCLENLISNAARYGNLADVIISQNKDFIFVAVCDTGPGIPEDRMDMVFEPFYRLEDSRNPKTGGFGLGLSIARTLARQCGGDVTIHNRPEGGLCATATFAVRPV